MTIIYDTKDNELPIAIFDSYDEASLYFDTNAQQIRETITRQKLRGNRYSLIKFDVKGWEDE
jgi:hypothetical protein